MLDALPQLQAWAMEVNGMPSRLSWKAILLPPRTGVALGKQPTCFVSQMPEPTVWILGRRQVGKLDILEILDF